jgi:hypothetical protein
MMPGAKLSAAQLPGDRGKPPSNAPRRCGGRCVLLMAAVVPEIYLRAVCSRQEVLRRRGRGQAPGALRERRLSLRHYGVGAVDGPGAAADRSAAAVPRAP